jgi:pimeloyl-ACP methyl ester carboxylesterase
MHRGSFLAGALAGAAVAGCPRTASAQPASYDLQTPAGSIYGTLLVPPGATAVVLIVAGSGPTDRDGNSPAGIHADSYRHLAEALAARRIATVRYDKRGIAASMAAGAVEANLRFDTFIDDAAAWLTKLRADGRFTRFGLAGHSEGSLIGMIAVQRVPVDAYISLGGAGFPADVILRRQLAQQLAPYPDLAAANTRILDALVAGRTVADVPAPLMQLYRASVQPYEISWFRYDPRVEIAKVHARVAIVQGTNDVQATVDDAKSLAAAHPGATLVIVPGMTHVLTDDTATTALEQSQGVYLDATRPVDPKVPQAIADAVGSGRG